MGDSDNRDFGFARYRIPHEISRHPDLIDAIERGQPAIWKFGEFPYPVTNGVALSEHFFAETFPSLRSEVCVHIQNVDVVDGPIYDSMRPAQIVFPGWIPVFVIKDHKRNLCPVQSSGQPAGPLSNTHLCVNVADDIDTITLSSLGGRHPLSIEGRGIHRAVRSVFRKIRVVKGV